MTLNEIMTARPKCVAPDTPLQEAARYMRDLDVGPLPVCGDDDRLVGMVTDRDITVRAVALGKDPKTTKVSDVMTQDIIYGFEDQDVDDAARVMEQRQIRRLVVLNRDKRLVGIVSLGDLAVEAHTRDTASEVLREVSEPAMSPR
jgi:CBS domain-containing protein